MASTSFQRQKDKFYVGHFDAARPYHVDSDVLLAANDAGYDTVTASITNNEYQVYVLSQLSGHLSFLEDAEVNSSNTFAHQSYMPHGPKLGPMTSSHTRLSAKDPFSGIILATSSWIDVASPDPLIADISSQVLKQEVEYASFCGATSLLVYGPRRYADEGALARYAHAVRSLLSIGPYFNIHVLLPMSGLLEGQTDMGDLARFVREDYRDPVQAAQEGPSLDSWEAWNLTREICNYHTRLSVGKTNTRIVKRPLHGFLPTPLPEFLLLPQELFRERPESRPISYESALTISTYSALVIPRHSPPTHIISRWFSEIPRMLVLPANSFIPNAKGNNVLSKANQALVNRFMKLNHQPWLLLADVEPIPGYEDRSSDGSSKHGKAHRRYGSKSAILHPHEGVPSITSDPTPAEASQSVPFLKKPSSSEPHVNYIRQHLERNQIEKSPLERFATGFQDYLQVPLQPLSDNLESMTYECFETDPIKYEWYEQAIAQTLRDWLASGQEGSGPSGSITLAVVGAGRGPLVTRAMRASEATGINVDVWAVEKNPSAFVGLQRHNEDEWNQKVNLVQSDMRSWKGPVYFMPKKSGAQRSGRGDARSRDSFDNDEDDDDDGEEEDDDVELEFRHVDILVSELLGSFADNELSPECLDGVQNVLNPRHGVSIPSSYTAHLTPIAAPSIHASITNRASSGHPDASQTPYVVMLQAIDYLSTTLPAASNRPHIPFTTKTASEDPVPVVKQVWKFTHPIPEHILKQAREGDPADQNAHNSRHSIMTFRCKNRGVCHGLAGYFETVLYEKMPYHINGIDESIEMPSKGRPEVSHGGQYESIGDWQGPSEEQRAPKIPSSSKIELSTNPLTMALKSKDMLSWFPIYFPLKEPVQFPDNSEMDVSMWRQTDGRRVWFEWLVEIFALITEPTGRAKRMRLQSTMLHSSEKSACLM